MPQQLEIEHNNDGGNRSRARDEPAWGNQHTHFRFIRRELHERDNREWELQTEDDLTEDQELARLRLAIEEGDAGGRNNRNGARDQAAQPTRQANIEKAFHHGLPGQGRRHGGTEAATEERQPEQDRGQGRAKQRRQQGLRLPQFDDFRVPGLVEARRRQDQNGGIDEERKHQGDGGIDGGVLDGLAFRRQRFPVGPGLHDRRMQVEVVWHDRGTEDAHRQVEHFGVAHDLRGRGKATDQRSQLGVGQRDLDGKAGRDDAEQGDDEGFEETKAELLQVKNEKDVEGGEEHANLNGNVKQQIEADGRADHFGDVCGDNGNFGSDPERIGGPRRIGVAARLRQVAPGGNRQARTQRLQQDRHDVGNQRDDEERVAELGTAGQRGCPVAGIHVADGNQIA